MTVVWDGTDNRPWGKCLDASLDQHGRRLVTPAVRPPQPDLHERIMKLLQVTPMSLVELAARLNGADRARVHGCLARLREHGAVIVVGRRPVVTSQYGRRSEAVYGVSR